MKVSPSREKTRVNLNRMHSVKKELELSTTKASSTHIRSGGTCTQVDEASIDYILVWVNTTYIRIRRGVHGNCWVLQAASSKQIWTSMSTLKDKVSLWSLFRHHRTNCMV